MKIRFSIILLLIYFNVGCSGSGNNSSGKHISTLKSSAYGKDVIVFSADSLQTIKLKNPKQLRLDLLSHYDVKKMRDLLLVSSMDAPYIHLFDSTMRLKHSFVNHGRGPGEALTSALNIDINQTVDRVSILDRQSSNLITYNLNAISDSKPVSPEKTIRLDRRFKRLLPYKGEFVGILSMCDSIGHNMAHVDYNGCTTRTFGYYPEGNSKYEMRIMPYIYTSDIAINHKTERLAIFYKDTDLFEIYSLNNDSLLYRIQGPDVFYPSIDVDNNQGSMSMRRIPHQARSAYSSCIDVNNEIWVSYSGGLFSQTDTPQSNYIYVFDWNGKPLRRYYIACDIVRFDYSDGNLYVVAHNETGSYINIYRI